MSSGGDMRGLVAAIDHVVHLHEQVQQDVVQRRVDLVCAGQRRPAIDRPADDRDALGVVEDGLAGVSLPFVEEFLVVDEPSVSRSRGRQIAELFARLAENEVRLEIVRIVLKEFLERLPGLVVVPARQIEIGMYERIVVLL